MMNWIKKTPATLKLVRWPNLLMIVFIQLSLYYAIIYKLCKIAGVQNLLNNFDLLILVLTTVLISAAGYVINDYFDMRADRINRPESMILGRKLDHRTGIFMHWVLNGVALILGIYLAWRTGSWKFGLLFPMIIMLLWLYSVKYKKTTFWGNLTVAFLAALVVVIVWLFSFFMLSRQPDSFVAVAPYVGMITKYFAVFAAFAFLLTFTREVIKDAEDIEGDRATGSFTLAVTYGIPVAKKVAMASTVLTLMGTIFVIISFANLGMVRTFIYFSLAVFIPLVYILLLTAKAKEKSDFHWLSTVLKLVMLAGVLGLQPIAMAIG
ncbi:MAG: geranylgeranylglycerol-phosphate geranylgeranyltransferase [Lentimicrobiaceae bacterium]